MTIPISEIYSSVQGESSFVGLPTTFIRTAGCPMRCRFCDTPYAFEGGTPYTINEILEKVDCQHVCITGGEPLIHEEIFALMTDLCDHHTVSLETSGCLPINDVDPRVYVICDIKCPGSGMADRNLFDNIDSLLPHHEVKFVICDRGDYEWAVDICQKYSLFKRVSNVLFSPAFKEMKAATLASWLVHDKLPARLNLQTHKFIWSAERRGV